MPEPEPEHKTWPDVMFEVVQSTFFIVAIVIALKVVGAL